MNRREIIIGIGAAGALAVLPKVVNAAPFVPGDALSQWGFEGYHRAHQNGFHAYQDVFIVSAYRRLNGVWEHVSCAIPAETIYRSSVTCLPNSPWQGVAQIGQPQPGRMLCGAEGEEPLTNQITFGPMPRPTSYIQTSGKLTVSRASPPILLEQLDGSLKWSKS